MRLAATLGLAVAAVEPRRTGARPYLLIERHDRTVSADGEIRRLHQEDFCQALGVPPEHKYAAEGGPIFRDGFDLVWRACPAAGAGGAAAAGRSDIQRPRGQRRRPREELQPALSRDRHRFRAAVRFALHRRLSRGARQAGDEDRQALDAGDVHRRDLGGLRPRCRSWRGVRAPPCGCARGSGDRQDPGGGRRTRRRWGSESARYRALPISSPTGRPCWSRSRRPPLPARSKSPPPFRRRRRASRRETRRDALRLA
jgi:hypothetical protein